MIAVDLHSHSLASRCGVHTVVEMLTRARDLGMTALAITDHGPALGGRLNSVFFERLLDPVPGVRLLKGMECNLDESPGAIDLPLDYLRYCDVVLVGLHANTPKGRSAADYTDLLVSALEANPFLDVVTHANSREYPLDYRRLARASRDLGRAVELNNSKVALGRVAPAVTESLIAACIREACPVVVASDAHTLDEVGRDEAIRSVMSSMHFPEELIINRTAEEALAFIERRRPLKLAHSAADN
ncbi:MAG: PHP domain-containing protein [Vicinamibacteria bacterium]|nr:PHP domain-containing protein [Vicinamibacteria bacterium]